MNDQVPRRRGNVEGFEAADGSTYYRVRLRLQDGSRERIDIPERHAGSNEDREDYALVRQQLEDEKHKLYKAKLARLEAKKRPAPAALSCDGYFERLLAQRAAEGVSDIVHDRSRWSKWVSPRLGKRPIASVTRDEIESVRDALDLEVKKRIAHGLGEGLSGKTAVNVWSILRITFKETVSSRDRSMRVRTDDPTHGHKPPLETDERQKTFIYPNEAAKLLACENVPLEWREVFALALYTYLRPGELRALTWGDVDLDAGVIHITKAYSESRGELGPPKTKNAVRDVPIDPALVPLLKRMHEAHADVAIGERSALLVVPLLADTNEKYRAAVLREALQIAGVGRARLFAETITTMQVNFRSCRDSGITWLALSGLELAKMNRRAGHDDLSTTSHYVKQAEDLSGKCGLPFSPLPSGLVSGQVTGQVGGKCEIGPKTGWRRGESNPSPKISEHRFYVRSRIFVSPRFAPFGGLAPRLVPCLISPSAR